MAQMSMNRAIHAAVRRDLGRFLGALEAFPADDHARAAQLATAWANFEHELTYHHEGEHATAWPALVQVGVSAKLLADLDAEHDAMARALAEAGRTIWALRESPTAEHARAAHAAMQLLQRVTVAHLDHEEAEIEPVYLTHRDHPAILAMGRRFGRVSPARGGQFLAWVSDGAGPDELAAIRGNVPAPVRRTMESVFGRGYRRTVGAVWR